MKKLLYIFISFLAVTSLFSCKHTEYVEVPVPYSKIEYRDRLTIDTFIINDSTIIKEQGDTVVLEKYKYLYRIKERKDTISIKDTITVTRTVTVTKEVNRLHSWQVILMVLGGAGVALGGYKLIKLIKT